MRRGRGRHGTKYTEEQEDRELLADEVTDGELGGHRLSTQPSVIKGGQMREYQLQGLNWLIHLYDNGINGILADEMVLPRLTFLSEGLRKQHLLPPCFIVVARAGVAELWRISSWCRHWKAQPWMTGIHFMGKGLGPALREVRVASACGAGPRQDATDDLAAGLPERVPRHLRAAHGHCAKVHAAQLDERVPQVVPHHPPGQVPRQPGGARACPASRP